MTATEPTYELFMQSALSDDDLGYPNKVAFVPAEEEWADEVIWRNLTSGTPTVIVVNGFEVLLQPDPPDGVAAFWDRLRGRRRVVLKFRSCDADRNGRGLGTRTSVGSHPLRELRELALV